MRLPVNDEVLARVERADIPFNRYGLDRFGCSREVIAGGFSLLKRLYEGYFTVTPFDIERVPDTGRAMLIGNHTGGLPIDGMMVATSMLLAHEPPRIVHAMVEKFAQDVPFISTLFSRSGQLTGLPEHARQLLDSERLLMVFPEGAHGTGKLYQTKYELVRFGTGFMRLAMEKKAPIVPFGFVGGVEALPTIHHAKLLARLANVPYWPVTPYLLPIPRPFPCQIYYGEPMTFEGDGTESDDTIERYVEQVRSAIRALIQRGLKARGDD